MTDHRRLDLRGARGLFGLGVPAAWLVASIAPFAAAWTRLPEPMACHWSLSGGPDGALPRLSLLVLHAASATLAAIGARLAVRRAPGPPGSIAPAVGLATFVGTLFALLALTVVWLNLDAASWRDAGRLPLWGIAGLLVATSGAAALASRGARRLERAADPGRAGRASVGLGPSERAFWAAGARNGVVGAASVVLVGAAVAAAVVASPRLAALLLVVAAVTATFSRARVQVNADGLRVALGPWSFPRLRVPLARIREARAIRVTPLAHGGWGYRGSLRLFGRAAVVIRGGPALELDLERERTLIITVDDPASAAGLLNDLAARPRS
jgi:hypothetical protein